MLNHLIIMRSGEVEKYRVFFCSPIINHNSYKTIEMMLNKIKKCNENKLS